MFVRSLRLKNFRCFEELQLDFHKMGNQNRERTIILGANGTGKSNILKSLALVTAGSNALGELLGDPNDWVRFGRKECKIELEMSTQKGELRNIALEIHRGDTLRDVMNRSSKSLDEIDNALNYTDRNYFVLGYGASRQMGGSRSGRKSRSFGSFYDSQRAQCISSLLDRQASLNSLEDWALDVDYRNEKEGKNIIRKVFDSFLDNIEFKGIDKRSRRLILSTQDGEVPLESLSDGYQNMAAWIGDLLYRISDIFSDRKDPLLTSGVLLLDEIDLHLHPKWQRKLVDFIKKTLPNMQLVATTHSPFTAQQLTEGELYTIDRIKGKPTLEAFTGNPQKLLLHQLIMSEAFGLDTDESVHVTMLRENYNRLRNKKRKTAKEKSDIKKLEVELKETHATSYSNSIITEKDRELILTLIKEINPNK